MTDMTTDEARKLLETVRIEKLKKCQAELDTLLEKHGCKLAMQLGIVDGRIIGNAVLTTRD